MVVVEAAANNPKAKDKMIKRADRNRTTSGDNNDIQWKNYGSRN
jgi:hypothetical protein